MNTIIPNLFLEQDFWIHASVVTLIIAMFGYVLRISIRKRIIAEVSWFSLLLSLLCMVLVFIVRSSHAHYFALSNMFESMMALAAGVMLAFLIVDRIFQLPTLGWAVCLLLIGMIGYAVTLPTDILPLQAALQSYWRAIHVPVIISSYGLFTLAFISSAIFLVQSYWKKSPADTMASSRLAKNMTLPVEGDSLLLMDKRVMSGTLIYDEITYRCVAFGFPLLAIGIILGGMWANEAWGNYWSWDPKESMSLATLLGYGVYLHLRVNGEHSPRSLAWVSVIGFALMLITYFGVNLMGVGLHSYGKIG